MRDKFLKLLVLKYLSHILSYFVRIFGYKKNWWQSVNHNNDEALLLI